MACTSDVGTAIECGQAIDPFETRRHPVVYVEALPRGRRGQTRHDPRNLVKAHFRSSEPVVRGEQYDCSINWRFEDWPEDEKFPKRLNKGS